MLKQYRLTCFAQKGKEDIVIAGITIWSKDEKDTLEDTINEGVSGVCYWVAEEIS